MEKVIQQLKDDRQRVLEENNRLQAVNAQLQLDNASLQQENTELKTRLGLSTSEIQIEFPPSPSLFKITCIFTIAHYKVELCTICQKLLYSYIYD